MYFIVFPFHHGFRLHHEKITNKKDLGIKWKVDSLLSDLEFADDIALLEEALRKQQELIANLENNARKAGLTISVEKLKP